MADCIFNQQRQSHESWVSTNGNWNTGMAHSVHIDEVRTTPLFSSSVLANVLAAEHQSEGAIADVLPQFGILANVVDVFEDGMSQGTGILHGSEPRQAVNQQSAKPKDNRLFLNINPPWSAFICGSQGSGKSHTLLCMLENALIRSVLGKLPQPLAGVVFHYDRHTPASTPQICEAAYLASGGITVKVLVSPSNIAAMKKAYNEMPNFPTDKKKPVVVPLSLQEHHLSIGRMMKLMAVDEEGGRMALYMESVHRILKSMAVEGGSSRGFNYAHFKHRLSIEPLNQNQKNMLNERLENLESFINLQTKSSARFDEMRWESDEDRQRRVTMVEEREIANAWLSEPSSLTIIDLSCPLVNDSMACALFDICLGIFLESRCEAGRVVALDEAHKFMGSTSASNLFTESLLSVIRQQRRLATRVIIASQEPTMSPALLDLCTMTIIHGFTSQIRLTVLKPHLARLVSGGEKSKRDVKDIINQIAHLRPGQAFLFSPLTLLRPDRNANPRDMKMEKLGKKYLRVQLRKRLTADGGKSLMAF